MAGKPLLRALGLMLCVACGTPALAAQAPMSEREVEALWSRYWREFAAHYVAFEDSYIQFPAMQRGATNSSGVDARDYERNNTHEMTFDDERGREQTELLRKPRAEVAVATKTLPALEPGAFGEIFSGKVAEIVDDTTVRLSGVWLFDPDAVAEDREADREALRKEFWGDIEEAVRREWKGRSRIADKTFELREAVDWRFEERDAALRTQRRNGGIVMVLHGFKTSPMAETQRWPSRGGVGVAVVKTQRREGFSAPEVHAIPLATARKGVTETQFAAMLEDRGLSRAQFVELVQETRKIELRGYKPLVLGAIENGGKLVLAAQDDADVDVAEPEPGGDVIIAE